MIVRETIIAAIGARLAAIPGLAAVELLPAVQPSVYPSLSLDDLGQQLVESDATHSRYTLNLQITGIVQGEPGPSNAYAGKDAHARANTLYAATVRALMADPDRLGELAPGVVETIDEGALAIDVSTIAVDFTISFTLDFTVQFINRQHDPALS